ncbi:hypothetical protein [Dickeya chrysanthemi]|uniref:hypothetical protein n=1 Tax=Dickeya chrysanthemi TaxID=556 RepID=UPI000A834B27|nr:hypothetical protein [Dickeya chrysanthemi]
MAGVFPLFGNVAPQCNSIKPESKNDDGLLGEYFLPAEYQIASKTPKKNWVEIISSMFFMWIKGVFPFVTICGRGAKL